MKIRYGVRAFLVASVFFGGFLLSYSNSFSGETVDANGIAERCSWASTYEEGLDCAYPYLLAIVEEQGLRAGYETIEDLQRDVAVFRDCHLAAHLMGQRAAASEDSGMWQDALAGVDLSTCNGGFIHGILEGYYKGNPDMHITGPLVTQFCATEQLQGYARRSCVHAIGHLVLIESKGNVEQGIRVCDEISDPFTFDERFECYLGLFMEHTTRLGLMSHGIVDGPMPLTEESVEKMEGLCKGLEEEGARACWTEIARVYVSFYKNPQDSITACGRVEGYDQYRQCTFFAIQLLASQQAPSVDHIDTLCGLLDKEDFHRCYAAIGDALVRASDEFIPLMEEFCAHLSGEDRKECSELLERWLVLYG